MLGVTRDIGVDGAGHMVQAGGIAAGCNEPRLDDVFKRILARPDEDAAASARNRRTIGPSLPAGQSRRESVGNRGLSALGFAAQKMQDATGDPPRPNPLDVLLLDVIRANQIDPL